MKKLLLILALWPTTLPATIYYCSNSGGNSSAGTIGDPWSISKACSTTILVATDTVYLRGGTYPAVVNFGTTGNLFVMNPMQDSVYYRSYPGEMALILGGKLQSPNICIVQAESADHITMDSIWFMYGSDYAFRVSGGGSDWVLRHCRIDSAAYNCNTGNNEGGIGNGVNFAYMRRWLVDSCTFTGNCGRGAIHVYGMESTEVRYCFFDRNDASENCIHIKSGVVSAGNIIGNNWHHNTFNLLDGGAMGFSAAVASEAPYQQIANNRMHHNVAYGTTSRPAIQFLSNPATLNHHSNTYENYIYNNTLDLSAGGRGITMYEGTWSNGTSDSLYIFNNIFFRPENTSASEGTGSETYNNSPGGAFGCCQFGEKFYSDHNAWIKRLAGDSIRAWYNTSGVRLRFSLAGWQDRGKTVNSDAGTYTVDSNSISTADSFNVFVDRGNRNYALDAAGANYTTLASGGRGGAWDTYMGALAPSGPLCPVATLNLPVNGSAVGTLPTDMQFDVVDGNNDTVLIIIQRSTTSPPTTTILIDTVATPTADYVFSNTDLANNVTYYWRVIIADTIDGDVTATCVDTTDVSVFSCDTAEGHPPVVVLNNPYDQSTVTSITKDMIFDLTDEDGDSLLIKIQRQTTSPPTTTIFIDTVTSPQDDYVFTNTALVHLQRYYWRVIVADSIDGDLQAVFVDTSDIWSFTVDTTTDPSGGVLLKQTILRGTRLSR